MYRWYVCAVSHAAAAAAAASARYCIAEGAKCARGDLVRCTWNGTHQYFGATGSNYGGNIDNGRLVWNFLQQWERPCHVGGGVVVKETSCAPVNRSSSNQGLVIGLSVLAAVLVVVVLVVIAAMVCRERAKKAYSKQTDSDSGGEVEMHGKP